MARVTKAELEQRVEELELEVKQLQTENNNLKKKYEYNVRGAGRKPLPDKKKKLKQIQKYLNNGYNNEQIMKKVNLKKATFYRYKKELIEKGK